MDKLISVPMEFLSGLEAQSKISELLDELFYRDNLARSQENLSSRPLGPSPIGPRSWSDVDSPGMLSCSCVRRATKPPSCT